MQTIEVRTFLNGRMQAVCERSYYGSAPASATFPYIVWDMKELSYEEGFSLQEIEVDVVDYGSDTTAAESLADALQAALDHLSHLGDSFHIAVYRERRQTLSENDKSVIRRRLTFQVRLHERSSL